jgi:hypothetical protein
MRRTFLALLLLAFSASPLHAQLKPKAGTTLGGKPAAKPAAEKEQPEATIIQSIMTCLADGLTPEWFKTWFVVNEIRRNAAGTARQFEATFRVANRPDDERGEPLKPCGAEQIIEGVGELNAYLPESQRMWTSAVFVFYRDGRYDAKYDYTPLDGPEKPAAKPAAKKDAKK